MIIYFRCFKIILGGSNYFFVYNRDCFVIFYWTFFLSIVYKKEILWWGSIILVVGLRIGKVVDYIGGRDVFFKF